MIWLGLPSLWGWLGLGFVLVALETLLAPGSYLLWVGLAALAMAALAPVFPLSAGGELALFGSLALIFALIGWKVYGAREKNDAARDLHDPATTFIGRELTLSSAIVDGIGQAKVDDSVWRVAGPDMAAGERVRVTSLDGATLVVERA